MAYFKIGDVDYSMYVNELKVNKSANYNVQQNAAGDSVVDYINHKREIEVGIIPLDDAAMAQLQTAIDAFNVSISFRNPQTNALEEHVHCIVPMATIEYSTIQVNIIIFSVKTSRYLLFSI